MKKILENGVTKNKTNRDPTVWLHVPPAITFSAPIGRIFGRRPTSLVRRHATQTQHGSARGIGRQKQKIAVPLRD